MLNREITQCETASEVFQKLQSTNGALTKKGGGGALNSVNFSTSIHRLGRFGAKGTAARAEILVDPRFALLLASYGEAMDPSNEDSMLFVSRELSTVSWAIAKLKIAPPTSVMPPLEASVGPSPLAQTCQEIRKQVLDYAIKRQRQPQQQQNLSDTQPPWLPNVSRLAGYVMDAIAVRVLEYNGPVDFKLQENANLLWAWATSSRVNEVAFRTVLERMMKEQTKQVLDPGRGTPEPSRNNEILNPQEWSNSIWAAATGQIFSPPLLDYVARLLREHPSFVNSFKPQELSNTAWGVATMLTTNFMDLDHEEERQAIGLSSLVILRSVALSALTRTEDFKTQELANTLWAMATVGFGLRPTYETTLSNYIVLASDTPEEDYALMRRTVAAISKASLQKISKFRSQELNNLAWALARLLDPDQVRHDSLVQSVLHSIGDQISDQKRPVSSQDVASSLWSLATLQLSDYDMYRAVACRMTPRHVRHAKPQELSNTLWALATAELPVDDVDGYDTTLVPSSIRPPVRDPVAALFGLVAEELVRRPYDFKPQEMKDCLWSFSKIGIRHPDLFRSTAIHLVGGDDDPGESSFHPPRGFSGFSSQGLGNTAWAFARQCQLACEVASRFPAGSTLLQSNGKLAVYTTSFFDYGETLVHRLFQAVANAGIEEHDCLRRFKPQDLANTAWTFGVMGVVHTRFLETVKFELVRRAKRFIQGDTSGMNSFKGQEVANLLWTMATLSVPAADIMDVIDSYVDQACRSDKGRVTPSSIAKVFKRQELANIGWSCAVFDAFPSKLMKLVFTGLFGRDDQDDFDAMCSLHGDPGLQRQAIVSSIYVMAAMDLRQTSGGLRLPADFPDGWGRQASSARDEDYISETMVELSVSTSKIQREVSAAFRRIGFLHVEEHIISMEDLARAGVNVAPKPMPILSIDIASLEHRVAVEVDGPSHFLSIIDGICETGGYSKLTNGKLEYQFCWSEDGHIINGPTLLKQRLLTLLGWKVIHLNFWDWYAVKGDEAAEDALCRRLLQ
jgi:hypothetical protein